VAATNDQILAAVTLLTRKIDTVITEMGILMSQADDISAATAELNTEVANLTSAHDELAALVQALRDQVAADAIPQSIMDGFDSALAKLKPAVDSVAAIAAPPPPPEPPAG
jgi:hypothetical protein